VMNAKGTVIANLTPGTALEFDPQASSQGEPWKLSGCLRAIPGHFMLTDDTTNVTVEAMGAGLDKEAGNRVEIIGAMDPTGSPVSGASQVIRVSQLKRIGKGCPASAGKGAAAAGAGGAAAGSTIAGISTTTILIIGGVAAAAAVGGLAASGTLSSHGSSTSR
jgi:hypothetical protein